MCSSRRKGAAKIWECPNEELKEVEERKRDSRSGMEGTIGVFVTAKPVVGMNKNSKNSLKVLQLSWKTPAFPGKGGSIMTQVSIDAFYGEGVPFAVDIEEMLARKDHVQISAVSVCAINRSLLGLVHHSLNRPG